MSSFHKNLEYEVIVSHVGKCIPVTDTTDMHYQFVL
jgi:hypothetical protein